MMAKAYGDFGVFERFWSAKNKAKRTQLELASSTAMD